MDNTIASIDDRENIVHRFIAAANRLDTEAVLSLFTSDASIDDVSVGEKFEQIPGIKKYFVTYFIGYQTSTRLLSLVHNEGQPIVARVDFTGDFGHETGALEFQVNEAGLIEYVHAYLD